MSWGRHAARILRGRAPWRAEEEFDYYRVEPERVREHAERQVAFEREAFLGGLQLARHLGVLGRSDLRESRILDVGAGECMLSEALALGAGAREVIALDAVPKQIWAAAAHHRGAGRLRFVIGDVVDLPFEDAAFDWVVANLVLHHVEPLAPLLESVLRVLRPGGRFAALEPAPLTGMLQHEATSANEAPLRPRFVERALIDAGFEEVGTQYWWGRLQSGALGPFSPAYRVEARRPGAGARAESALRRPLVETELPGLWADPECSFLAMARDQMREIRALWAEAERVPGFRGSG